MTAQEFFDKQKDIFERTGMWVSNNPSTGPWYLILCADHCADAALRAKLNSAWYIWNEDTGKFRKIGRVGAPRVNYYDRAIEEVERLNLVRQLAGEK
jgi:hypothetical protein